MLCKTSCSCTPSQKSMLQPKTCVSPIRPRTTQASCLQGSRNPPCAWRLHPGASSNNSSSSSSLCPASPVLYVRPAVISRMPEAGDWLAPAAARAPDPCATRNGQDVTPGPLSFLLSVWASCMPVGPFPCPRVSLAVAPFISGAMSAARPGQPPCWCCGFSSPGGSGRVLGGLLSLQQGQLPLQRCGNLLEGGPPLVVGVQALPHQGLQSMPSSAAALVDKASDSWLSVSWRGQHSEG